MITTDHVAGDNITPGHTVRHVILHWGDTTCLTILWSHEGHGALSCRPTPRIKSFISNI